MVESVRDALEKLNEALRATGITPYLFGLAAPDDLTPAPKNARFMSNETFGRLTSNIRKDGNLSSLPFCWWDGNRFWVLSGNHRVDAAREAGVEYILFLYTDAALSQSERTSIQLSHNALVGDDNLAVLKDLYESLESVEDQQYAGIDDLTIEKFEEVAPAAFTDAGLEFEDVSLLFMPHEVEQVEAVVARLREYSGTRVWAASVENWSAFWDTLMRFKDERDIMNTNTAIMVMVSIVNEWLDQDGELGETG